MRDRVRPLACYFVQLIFMYVPVQPEDAHLAAAAAVALACLSLDEAQATGLDVREVLAEMEEERRSEQGRGTLGVAGKAALNDRVFEIKVVVLRALRFDLLIELPHTEVDGLVTRLLSYSPGGAARLAVDFRNRMRELPGDDEDERPMSAAMLKQLLSGLARKFLDDMLLSMSPIVASPRTLAAGAVLAAMQAVSSSSSTPTLFQVLQTTDRWLSLPQLRTALQEWSELRCSQGKPVVMAL